MDRYRYRTISVDVFRGEKFLRSDRLDIRLVKGFNTFEWCITKEELSKSIQAKYPYLSKQRDIHFIVS